MAGSLSAEPASVAAVDSSARLAGCQASDGHSNELFKALLALSRDLSDEEQRHVREHLTEDELTVFDLLTMMKATSIPARRSSGSRWPNGFVVAAVCRTCPS